MFRSRGCRQTRAWRRRSLGRRRKHGDGTTSDDFDGCRSRRRASLPVIHVCRRLFLPRRSSARLLGGGACATRTLSTRQSTRAEIGAPQQHPCAPHALQEGLGGTPIGRQGLLVPAPSPGPPLESAEWAVCDQQQAGRPVVGSRHSFLLFPSSRRRGVGDIPPSPLSRPRGGMGCDGRGGGWRTPTQIRERQAGPRRQQQAKHLGCLISRLFAPPCCRLFCVTNLPATPR